jgi:serine/threonine-protein kinase RsbW
MLCQAVLENLPQLIRYIDEQARKVGFPSNDLYMVQLASEEALVNVMHYAYRKKETGNVEVTCVAVPDSYLKITILDQGSPFNPTKFQSADQKKISVDKRPIGGLGIFYLKEGMDEIKYKRLKKCNILELLKYYKPIN